MDRKIWFGGQVSARVWTGSPPVVTRLVSSFPADLVGLVKQTGYRLSVAG